MTKAKTFEEKVRAMSAKQIIMAMVNGLKHPKVEIDMTTFGTKHRGICYGCAATNVVCKISGKTFTSDNIVFTTDRAKLINSNLHFLDSFEMAIDNLRSGSISGYNYIAERNDFALIKYNINTELPCLHTHDYKDNLKPYIELAKSQNTITNEN